MSDGVPEATAGAPDSSMVASPEQLRREAVSLGLILLVTLTLAMLERHGVVPWDGYLSSLVLLVLSVWHKWRFGVAIRFFFSRRDRRTLPLALAMVLAVILLLAAHTLYQQWPIPRLSPVDSLHLLLLVPLSEEFYFRGLLLDHLRRGLSAMPAVLLCSLLFAMLHFPFTATLTAGCLSLVACALVLKTGTLACALQLHIAWNALSEIYILGDPSSRWGLAVFASGVVVLIAIARSKQPRRRSDDHAD